MEIIEDNPNGKIASRANMILEQSEKKRTRRQEAEVLVWTMKNGRIVKSNSEWHVGTSALASKFTPFDYTPYKLNHVSLDVFSEVCFHEPAKDKSKGIIFLFHDVWMHT